MAFRQGKNRRRAGALVRVQQVKSAVASQMGTALRIAALAGVGAGLVFGGSFARRWALTAPAFALRTLSFHGLSRASESELERLSGLSLGQNLWAMDPDAVAQAMATHPWVRRAVVTRRWPRAVVVDVEEHTPEAMASLNDLYLLNAHGEPFKKVSWQDGVNLALVTGVSREEYMRDPRGAVERFQAALAAARAYAESPAAKGERLSEVRILGQSLSLVTGAGDVVWLGTGGVDEKLERLARVRQELARRGLTAASIHLDNRQRPGWVAVELASRASDKVALP